MKSDSIGRGLGLGLGAAVAVLLVWGCQPLGGQGAGPITTTVDAGAVASTETGEAAIDLLGKVEGGTAGLDGADLAAVRQAFQRAVDLPVGGAAEWSNPASGNSGSIAVVRRGYDRRERPCREFGQEVAVDGDVRRGDGVACQDLDGTWRVVRL